MDWKIQSIAHFFKDLKSKSNPSPIPGTKEAHKSMEVIYRFLPAHMQVYRAINLLCCLIHRAISVIMNWEDAMLNQVSRWVSLQSAHN